MPNVYVADTKKWSDFFVNTATTPAVLTNSYSQRGGNLGNGTQSASRIVPVDARYVTRERRGTPEITLVSSAQRDVQQAQSELRRKKKRKKSKKRKRNDNFD